MKYFVSCDFQGTGSKDNCPHWCHAAEDQSCLYLHIPTSNSKMQRTGERKIPRSEGSRLWELRDTDSFSSDNHTFKNSHIFGITFSPFFCCNFATFIWLFATLFFNSLSLPPKKAFLCLFVCLFSSPRSFNRITGCQKQRLLHFWALAALLGNLWKWKSLFQV